MAVAVLGSVMTNRYQQAFQANLPEAVRQVVPPDRLAAVQNPQVLLSSQATDLMWESFAAMGSNGQELFEQVLQVIRVSLASAISGLFLALLVAMVVGFVATLFLPEIRLRRGSRIAPVDDGPVV